MSTITVSIGRNVGAEPMGWQRWESFIDDTKAGVTFSGHTIIFYGEGAGVWEGESERAFTVVALATDTSDTDALTVYLGRLAEQYGQDAIAITTGETVLAGLTVKA